MTDAIKPLQNLIRFSCRHARELWERTKNKDDGKRIPQRKRFLRIYKEKICAEATYLLDYCLPLINENNNMMFEDFFNELGNMTMANEPARQQNTQWIKCAKLFISDYSKLKFYEGNERKGLCKYIHNADYVYRRYTNNNGELIDYVESFPIRENKVLCGYCEYRGTFEYELCSKVAEYVYVCFGMDNSSSKIYALCLITVCFYIAMKNEAEYLLVDEAICNLDGQKLDSRTGEAQQTTTPEPQGKRTKPVKIPHELNTPKGRKLLQKVIKAGYCDKYYNWDDSKWLSGKSRLALACFAYRASAYLNLSTKTNKEGDPTTNWQPFETLFTYQGKEEGKNKLMQTKRDYMKTKTSFIPEEMDAISKLFH